MLTTILHTSGTLTQGTVSWTPLLQEEEFLKRYLEYCRVKCSPRLTQRAAANLATDYVEIREEVLSLPSLLP